MPRPDSQRNGILPRWIRSFRPCWKLLAWIWGGLLFGLFINVGSSWLISKGFDLHGTPLGWGIEHPWITIPLLFLLVSLTLLARLAVWQDHTISLRWSQSSSNPPIIRPPIGRDKLLLALKQQLKNPSVGSRIAVLHGQLGVGKTMIAAQLARDDEIIATFSGGVLWAGLGENPSLDNILEAWARQLGVDLSSARTTQQRIASRGSATERVTSRKVAGKMHKGQRKRKS